MNNLNFNYKVSDYTSINRELQSFLRFYYPDSYKDFSISEPGQMFINMVSYISDIIYTKSNINFRESLVSDAQFMSSLYKHSKNSYKIKTSSAAFVTLDISILIPSILNNATNEYEPDWRYGLIINPGMTVLSRADQSVRYRTIQPCMFKPNFVDSIVVSQTNINNQPTYYLVTCKVLATSAIEKNITIPIGELKKYLTLDIVDDNIIDVISIKDGDSNEYFKVDYLAQDTIYERIPNTSIFGDTTDVRNDVPFLIESKKVFRRYITWLESPTTLKVQFGGGLNLSADEEIIPNLQSLRKYGQPFFDGQIDYSNFIDSKVFGIVPANTNLNITYLTGQGISSNVGVGELTLIENFDNITDITGLNTNMYNFVVQSIVTTNNTPGTGSIVDTSKDNIRQNIILANNSTKRAVSADDYMSIINNMPAEFGSVATCYVRRSPNRNLSNTIEIYVMSIDKNGNFVPCNTTLKQNLKEYITPYRILTDHILILDSFVINLGIDYEINIRSGFDPSKVIYNCNRTLANMFSNANMKINKFISISDIYLELDKVDGVNTVFSINITNKQGGNYSNIIYEPSKAIKNGILYPSLTPSVFEIKFPTVDIRGQVI